MNLIKLNNQRNSSVELLRFIFMFLIVLGHVYGFGVGFDTLSRLSHEPMQAFHMSAYSLSQIGSTGFIFISGYYGIKMNRDKWIKILSFVVFYYIVQIVIEGRYSFKDVMGVTYAFNSAWFISCYLFLCAISPLIEKSIRNLTQREYLFIIAFSIYYMYYAHFVVRHNDHNVAYMLTVYLVARYIKSYPVFFERHYKILGIVSLILILFFPYIVGVAYFPGNLIWMFLSNNNILYLILTMSLMLFCCKHNFVCLWCNYLCSSVLAIYLITEMTVVWDWLTTDLVESVLHGAGIFIILLVCVLCLIADKIREMVVSYMTNNL